MEEISMKQMIARFKTHFSEKVSEPIPKFPIQLLGEIEMKAKLSATYELSVERRGGHVNWDIVTKASIDSVVNWMYDKHRWLILYGSPGTGKTSILRALKILFPASIHCTATAIFDEYKKNERMPDVPGNRILLLDDLGAEPMVYKIFGEDRTPITDLLLQRYDQLATTVIATNLNIDDIQARYSARLADRIIEMATAILYNAPSYRGR